MAKSKQIATDGPAPTLALGDNHRISGTFVGPADGGFVVMQASGQKYCLPSCDALAKCVADCKEGDDVTILRHGVDFKLL